MMILVILAVIAGCVLLPVLAEVVSGLGWEPSERGWGKEPPRVSLSGDRRVPPT
jgi:hypothetical protein